jgi:hypothetical protein
MFGEEQKTTTVLIRKATMTSRLNRGQHRPRSLFINAAKNFIFGLMCPEKEEKHMHENKMVGISEGRHVAMTVDFQ